jgi:hypothetical protein
MRVCVCVGLCARRRGDGVADVQPFRYQDSRAADGVVMESQKKNRRSRALEGADLIDGWTGALRGQASDVVGWG